MKKTTTKITTLIFAIISVATVLTVSAVPSASAAVGDITTYEWAPVIGQSYGATTGEDGNVWFAGYNFVSGSAVFGVGKTTPAGVTTFYPTTQPGYSPSSIVSAEGSIWTIGSGVNGVVRIAPDGSSETAYPGADILYVASGTSYHQLASDGNGHLWFPAVDTSAQGVFMRFTIATGQYDSYPMPDAVIAMTADADGNIWYISAASDAVHGLHKVSPDGTDTAYPVLTTAGSGSGCIAKGYNDTILVWGNNQIFYEVSPSDGSIIRSFNTGKPPIFTCIVQDASGSVWLSSISELIEIKPDNTMVPHAIPPNPATGPTPFVGDLALGSDGNLWILANNGQIDRLQLVQDPVVGPQTPVIDTPPEELPNTGTSILAPVAFGLTAIVSSVVLVIATRRKHSA